MPIRNQIETIAKSLSVSTAFAYGTAHELNLLADDLLFPCIFLYPLQPFEISPAVNGSVDNTFPVYIEFLYKTEFGQFTADNESLVSQALHLANEFVVKAAMYREGEGRYFKIKSNLKARCVPVYNKYDVNTTGVGLTITLNTMYFEQY